MNVHYEWVVEELDDHDDIIECHYWDTPSEAAKLRDELQAEGKRVDFGVCRRVGDNIDGEVDRQYAYLTVEGWPDAFEYGAAIPKYIRAQMDRIQSEVGA
jgi:hypothetical protein